MGGSRGVHGRQAASGATEWQNLIERYKHVRCERRAANLSVRKTTAPVRPTRLSSAELAGCAAPAYCALRSFSRVLYLSPFKLDAFCACLVMPEPTPLLSEVHIALLRILLPFELGIGPVKQLSSASGKAVLPPDQSIQLLDDLTWPTFLWEYIRLAGKRTDVPIAPKAFKRVEYYLLPVEVKLRVLSFLTDELTQTGLIKSEIETRLGLQEKEEDHELEDGADEPKKHLRDSLKRLGTSVEVLALEDGLMGCRFVGRVIASTADSVRVRYDELLCNDGVHKLEEWVSLAPVSNPAHQKSRKKGRGRPKRLVDEGFDFTCDEPMVARVRPLPPQEKSPTSIKRPVKQLVEAYIGDGWWEGVVTKVADSSGKAQIFFPGENDMHLCPLKDIRTRLCWNSSTGMWYLPGVESLDLDTEADPSIAQQMEVENVGTPASASKAEKGTGNPAEAAEEKVPAAQGEDGPEEDENSDVCVMCQIEGSLICCEICPAAFHLRCVGETSKSLPEGDWFCPECAESAPSVQGGSQQRQLSKAPQNQLRVPQLGRDAVGRTVWIEERNIFFLQSADSQNRSRLGIETKEVEPLSLEDELRVISDRNLAGPVSSLRDDARITCSPQISSHPRDESRMLCSPAKALDVKEILGVGGAVEVLDVVGDLDVTFMGLVGWTAVPDDQNQHGGAPNPTQLLLSDEQLHFSDEEEDADGERGEAAAEVAALEPRPTRMMIDTEVEPAGTSGEPLTPLDIANAFGVEPISVEMSPTRQSEQLQDMSEQVEALGVGMRAAKPVVEVSSPIHRAVQGGAGHEGLQAGAMENHSNGDVHVSEAHPPQENGDVTPHRPGSDVKSTLEGAETEAPLEATIPDVKEQGSAEEDAEGLRGPSTSMMAVAGSEAPGESDELGNMSLKLSTPEPLPIGRDTTGELAFQEPAHEVDYLGRCEILRLNEYDVTRYINQLNVDDPEDRDVYTLLKHCELMRSEGTDLTVQQSAMATPSHEDYDHDSEAYTAALGYVNKYGHAARLHVQGMVKQQCSSGKAGGAKAGDASTTSALKVVPLGSSSAMMRFRWAPALPLSASSAAPGEMPSASALPNKAVVRELLNLASVAGHIVHMERMLHCLLDGSWVDPEYRRSWILGVRHATNVRQLRRPLLQMEASLRRFVFCPEWFTHLESHWVSVINDLLPSGLETSAEGARLVPAECTRLPGRATRRLARSPCTRSAEHVQWTQEAAGAHEGITYELMRDGLAARELRTAWRAAVENACTVSDLALQIRVLDAYIRWEAFKQPAGDKKEEKEQDKVLEKRMVKRVLSEERSQALSIAQAAINRRSQPMDAEYRLRLSGQWMPEAEVPIWLVRQYEQDQRKDAATSGELYCFCQQPWDPDRDMIGCDYCDGWYHYDCVGISEAEAETMDKYKCDKCKRGRRSKLAPTAVEWSPPVTTADTKLAGTKAKATKAPIEQDGAQARGDQTRAANSAAVKPPTHSHSDIAELMELAAPLHRDVWEGLVMAYLDTDVSRQKLAKWKVVRLLPLELVRQAHQAHLAGEDPAVVCLEAAKNWRHKAKAANLPGKNAGADAAGGSTDVPAPASKSRRLRALNPDAEEKAEDKPQGNTPTEHTGMAAAACDGAAPEDHSCGACKLRVEALGDGEGTNKAPAEAADISAHDRQRCLEVLAALRKIEEEERSLAAIFERLPTKKQMPSYYQTIKHPVDLKGIEAGLTCQGGGKAGSVTEYTSVQRFAEDMELMFDNAQIFNMEGSEIYCDAGRLRQQFRERMQRLFPALKDDLQSPASMERGAGAEQAEGKSTSGRRILIKLRQSGSEEDAGDDKPEVGGGVRKVRFKLNGAAAGGPTDGGETQQAAAQPLVPVVVASMEAAAVTPTAPVPGQPERRGRGRPSKKVVEERRQAAREEKAKEALAKQAERAAMEAEARGLEEGTVAGEEDAVVHDVDEGSGDLEGAGGAGVESDGRPKRQRKMRVRFGQEEEEDGAPPRSEGGAGFGAAEAEERPPQASMVEAMGENQEGGSAFAASVQARRRSLRTEAVIEEDSSEQGTEGWGNTEPSVALREEEVGETTQRSQAHSGLGTGLAGERGGGVAAMGGAGGRDGSGRIACGGAAAELGAAAGGVAGRGMAGEGTPCGWTVGGMAGRAGAGLSVSPVQRSPGVPSPCSPNGELSRGEKRKRFGGAARQVVTVEPASPKAMPPSPACATPLSEGPRAEEPMKRGRGRPRKVDVLAAAEKTAVAAALAVNEKPIPLAGLPLPGRKAQEAKAETAGVEGSKTCKQGAGGPRRGAAAEDAKPAVSGDTAEDGHQGAAKPRSEVPPLTCVCGFK
ncbi:hypothetical protein CYMTET_20483 [Cymbomonas tetramitiformis]|uniref:Uncharacterized protein n=1 Tax=Cymbomonas tetramitiformis TaxID=36881 RepID=A0AAE0G3Y6_9CHLO|nr:hypothetical protein CYMTET_20483 [Cymbomonas tetramitiformis]